jgi:thiol-disulfide isomerase/thioredoxin/uncharacterized protein (DUF983 family)
MMRTFDHCPACVDDIRWHHLLSQMIAPFYFKCKYCGARLRLREAGQFVAANVCLFVGMWLAAIGAMIITALLFRAAGWIVLLAASGIVAIVVGHSIQILSPLQGGRIRVREPQLLGEPAARRYFFTGLTTYAVMLVMIVPFGLSLLYLVIFLGRVPGLGASFAAPKLPAPEEAVTLGRLNPGWTVRGLDGKVTKIADLHGKVLFINIWATWCAPCVAEMPSIEALHKSLADSNVAFLIVSKEPEQTVRLFVQKKQWTLPFYLNDRPLPPMLETEGIPATFIVNTKGEIVFRHVGASNWDSDQCRDFLLGLP